MTLKNNKIKFPIIIATIAIFFTLFSIIDIKQTYSVEHNYELDNSRLVNELNVEAPDIIQKYYGNVESEYIRITNSIDNWYYGYLTKQVDNGREAPHIFFFLLEIVGDEYNVYYEQTPEIKVVQNRVPLDLLLEVDRLLLFPQSLKRGGEEGGFIPLSQQSNFPDLYLPWDKGVVDTFNGGPHSTNYAAVDFGILKAKAMAPGKAKTFSGCGNNNLVFIVLDNGYKLHYYHMENIVVTNDQDVEVGDLIGDATGAYEKKVNGVCNLAHYGQHLHLALRDSAGTYLGIDELYIGGWQIVGTKNAEGNLYDPYEGCAVKGGVERCKGGYNKIYNNNLYGDENLQINDFIQAGNVNVRDSAGGDLLKNIKNKKGKLIDGYETKIFNKVNYNWWKVHWDEDGDGKLGEDELKGWVIEDNMYKLDDDLGTEEPVIPQEGEFAKGVRVEAVNASQINIKKTPCDFFCKTISKITEGTKGEIYYLEPVNEWWGVKWDNGVIGWVEEQYIRVIQEEEVLPEEEMMLIEIPELLEGKYHIGDQVKVSGTGGSGLIVRTTASGSQIGTVAEGTTGIIQSSGYYAKDGYKWWEVDWTGGVSGWSIEKYIYPYEANPWGTDFSATNLQGLRIDPNTNSVDFILKAEVAGGGDQIIDLEADSDFYQKSFLQALTIPNYKHWISLEPDPEYYDTGYSKLNLVTLSPFEKTELSNIMFEADIHLKTFWDESLRKDQYNKWKELMHASPYWSSLDEKGFNNNIFCPSRAAIIDGDLSVSSSNGKVYVQEAQLGVESESFNSCFVYDYPLALSNLTQDEMNDLRNRAGQYSIWYSQKLEDRNNEMVNILNSNEEYREVKKVYSIISLAQWYKTLNNKNLPYRSLIDTENLIGLEDTPVTRGELLDLKDTLEFSFDYIDLQGRDVTGTVGGVTLDSSDPDIIGDITNEEDEIFVDSIDNGIAVSSGDDYIISGGTVFLPSVDVAVESILFSEDALFKDVQVDLEFKITNYGENESGQFTVKIFDEYINSEGDAQRLEIYSEDISNLTSWESNTISTTWKPWQKGNHTIIVQADAGASLSESNIANNIKITDVFVGSDAPYATITYPLPGDILDTDGEVLTGQYYDAVETLNDSDMSWSSDVDGFLGNGQNLTVNGLSTGEHLLTFTVENSKGFTDSAETLVYVGSPDDVNIHITTPIDGSTHSSGVYIKFTGNTYDTNFTTLCSVARWGSSIDGDLGNGCILNKKLSIGNHEITFSVEHLGEIFSFSRNITIVDGLPQITLLSPPDETSFDQEQEIGFLATAIDPQDGDISENVKWYSESDGILGTGSSITKKLSVGYHHIVASIEDNDGLRSTAEFSVTVEFTSPDVEITKPLSDTTYEYDTMVELEADVSDFQDGSIDDSQVRWISSLQGLVGTGADIITSELIPGTHDITTEAVDSDGAVGSDTVYNVKIDAGQPDVEINLPIDGGSHFYGFPITFNGEGVDPTEGDLPDEKLEWVSNIDGTIGNGKSLEVSNMSVGEHRIRLIGSDTQNLTGTDTIDLIIEPPHSPEVTIISPPNNFSILRGEEITFQAEVSDYEDGELDNSDITWVSSIDATLGNGKNISLDNLSTGVHEITIQAQDSTNYITQVQVIVTIIDTPPTAEIIAPSGYQIYKNTETITLSGSATDYEDGNLSGDSGDTIIWTSNIDGELGRSLSNLELIGLTSGEHLIQLQAKDSYGNETIDEVKIFVESQRDPNISFWSPRPNSEHMNGELITFGAVVNDYEDVDVEDDKVIWTSSIDGEIGSGKTLSIDTLSIGEHVITVEAEDSQGGKSSLSLDIRITNRTPDMDITSPTDGALYLLGEEIQFIGSGNDVEDGPVETGKLTWISSIDGVIDTGDTILTSSLSEGLHEITLFGEDSQGSQGQTKVTVIVSNPQNQTISTLSEDEFTYISYYAEYIECTGGPWSCYRVYVPYKLENTNTYFTLPKDVIVTSAEMQVTGIDAIHDTVSYTNLGSALYDFNGNCVQSDCQYTESNQLKRYYAFPPVYYCENGDTGCYDDVFVNLPSIYNDAVSTYPGNEYQIFNDHDHFSPVRKPIIDIAENGDIDWENTDSYFASTEIITDFSDDLNWYLANTSQTGDMISVPIKYGNNGSFEENDDTHYDGRLKFSNINIQYYIEDKEYPSINSYNLINNPVQSGSDFIIQSNVTDNIEVDTVEIEFEGSSYTADNSGDDFTKTLTATTKGNKEVKITARDINGLETSETLILQILDTGIDLEVLSEDVSFDENIEENDTVSVQVKVYNHGNVNAENVEVELEKDGFAEDFEILNINAGSYTIFNLSFTAQANDNQFSIIVNPDNTIVETDYTNNQVDEGISVYDTTAPRIDSVEIVQDKIFEGDTFQVIADVDDLGGIDRVEILNLDELDFNSTTDKYEKEFIAEAPLGSGMNDLKLKVTNSSGLVSTEVLTINILQEQLDVEVNSRSLSISPSIIYPGDSVSIDLTVFNRGNVDLNNFNAECEIGGVSLGVNEISVSDKVTTQFSWTADLGDHTLECIVNESGLGAEIDQTNNTVVKSVSVQDTEAPVVNNITISPNPMVVGEEFSIEVDTIDNYGVDNVELVGYGVLAYNVGSGLYEGSFIPTGTLPTDTETYQVIVEDQKGLKTQGEVAVGMISNLPDLTISNFDFVLTPEEMQVNKEAELEVLIKNIGAGDANNFDVECMVGSTSLGVETLSLVGGTYDTIHFSWYPELSHKKLNCNIDSTNNIVEYSETNNTAELSISVYPDPDVPVIQDVSTDPEEIFSEQDFVLIIDHEGTDFNLDNVQVTWDGDVFQAVYDDVNDVYQATLTAPFTLDSITEEVYILSTLDNGNQKEFIKTIRIDIEQHEDVPYYPDFEESPIIESVLVSDDLYVDGQMEVDVYAYDDDEIDRVEVDFDSQTYMGIYNETEEIYEFTIDLNNSGIFNLAVTAYDDLGLSVLENQEIQVLENLPDLEINPWDIVVTDQDGINVGLSVKVHNPSRQNTTNILVELYRGVVQLDSVVIPSILSNSDETVDFTYTADDNYSEITIKVDPDNTIIESDEDNNEASRTIATEISQEPPTTPEPVVDPTGWSDSDSYNISWNESTATAGIKEYKYQLDLGDWISNSTNTSVNINIDKSGIHQFLVKAIDNNDQESDVGIISIKQDKSAPNVPVLQSPLCETGQWTDNANPIFTWNDSGDEGSGIEKYVININNTQEIDLIDLYTYTDTITSSGEHTYKIAAEDAIGQRSAWSNEVICRVDFDKPELPVITSDTHPLQTENYNDNKPHFNWDEPNDLSGISGYKYIFNTTEDYEVTRNGMKHEDKSLNLDIYPMLYFNEGEEVEIPNGEWYLHLAAEDKVGNLSDTATYKVNILVVDDTDAPEVQIDQLTTNDTTPVITGTIDDTGANLSLRILEEQYQAVINDDFSWTAEVTTELTDAVYSITTSAEDQYGNSADKIFSDVLTIITEGPEITYTDPVSDTTSILDFVSFIADDADLSYAISDDGVCNEEVTYISGNEYLLENENQNGKYFCARAEDVYGNVSYLVSDNTFNIDRTAPLVHTTLLATTEVKPIIWGTVDDTSATVVVSINGYEYDAYVFDDGVWGAQVEHELTEGETYDVEVVGTDPLGNMGTESSELIIIDGSEPEIVFNNNVEEGPVLEDTVEFTIDDGVESYAISDDIICDDADTYQSGNSFYIDTEEHNGKYFCARAVDADAGHTEYLRSEYPFNIDRTAPSFTYIEIIETTDNQPYLSGSIDDTSATLVFKLGDKEYYPNIFANGSWGFEVPEVLEDGEYPIVITATDIIGNKREETYNIKINANGPEINFTQEVQEGPVKENIVEFYAEGAYGEYYGFSDDLNCEDEDYTSGSYYKADTEEHNGEYFCAKAEDDFGNVTYAVSEYPFNIDISSPGFEMFEYKDHDNTPTLYGEVDDPDAIVKITVNDIEYSATNRGDGTWEVTITEELDDGEYIVYGYVEDQFGNSGNRTSRLVIDTTAPKVSGLEDIKTANQKPTIQGYIDDTGALLSIYIGTVYDDDPKIEEDGSWKLEVEEDIEEGIYRYTAVAFDEFGNMSLEYASLEIDITPPEITMEVTETTEVNPTLWGYIDDTGATVTVNISDTDYVADFLDTGTWEIEITNDLTEGEIYQVQVIASDDLGNENSIQKELKILDTTAPEITFIDNVEEGPVSEDLVQFSADTGDLSYAISEDNTCNEDDSYEAGNTILVNTENYNGKYFCARVIDGHGNIGYLRSDYPFNIDRTGEEIVFIDNVEIGPVLSDTVNFLSTGSVLRYAYTEGVVCDDSLTYDTGSSLVVDTEVHNGEYLCVLSIDSLGNVNYAISQTTFNIDRTAPSFTYIEIIETTDNQPYLSGSIDDTSATLIFKLGEEEYYPNIFINGSWGFEVPEVLEDGEYLIVITATDIIGNKREETFNIKINANGPEINFTQEVQEGPVKVDTVNYIAIGASQTFYAFSEDQVCDESEEYYIGHYFEALTEEYNGKYFCAKAVDDFGNTTYAVSDFPFNIDSSSPGFEMFEYWRNGKTPTLEGFVDDPDAVVRITVNSIEYSATNYGNGMWGVEITNDLDEGEYTIYGYVEDEVGNSGNYTSKLVIDLQAPELSGVNDIITSETIPDITGQIDDTSAFIIVMVGDTEYSTEIDDNGEWYAEIEDEIAEGIYQYSVYAMDPAGNENVKYGQVIIDLTPPEITMEVTETTEVNPTLWGYIDDTGATITLTINGHEYSGTVSNDGIWEVHVEHDLTMGEIYTVQVTTSDVVGNENSIQKELKILDTTAPEITFIDNVEEGPVSEDLVQFSADTGDLSYAISEDNTCNEDDSYEAGNTILVNTENYNGKYFCARVIDGHGNIGYLRSDYPFNIAFEVPEITFTDEVEEGPVKSEQVTFSATGAYILSYAVSDNAICDDNDIYEVGNELTVNTENYNGKYFCARAESDRGVIVYENSEYPFNIDITAPEIEFTDRVNVGPVRYDIVEFTSTEGDLSYAISEDDNCNEEDDYNSGSYFEIDSETLNGQYFCARAEDEVGYVTYERSEYTFNIDIQAPGMTIENLATRDNTPILTGEVDDSGAIITVTIDNEDFDAEIDNGEWRVDIQDELEDGEYEITAMISDEAGNDGTYNAILIIDTKSPLVTVEELSTTNPQPLIVGNIDDEDVEIEVEIDGKVYTGVNKKDGTWEVLVNNPLVSGVYDLIITAIDFVGNIGMDNSVDELVILNNEKSTQPVNTSGGGDTIIKTPGSSGTDYADSKFSSHIFYLIRDKIVDGYPDGKFHPERTLTRGQLAKFLVNAFGLEYYLEGADDQFSDVPSDHTFADYIAVLKEFGISDGFSDGEFKPDQDITREESVKLIVKAMEAAGIDLKVEDYPEFSDISKDDLYLAYLYSNGIIDGYSDGTFKPLNEITRGEMAKIIDLARKMLK